MSTSAKVVIVGFGVLLAIGALQNRGTTAAPVAPTHQLKVLSIACDPNYTRPRADVAVQNIGQTTIDSAKAVVSFGGEIHDSYLRPLPLRPGGIATASVYTNDGGSVACSLVAVQDRDGFAASLAR